MLNRPDFPYPQTTYKLFAEGSAATKKGIPPKADASVVTCGVSRSTSQNPAYVFWLGTKAEVLVEGDTKSPILRAMRAVATECLAQLKRKLFWSFGRLALEYQSLRMLPIPSPYE